MSIMAWLKAKVAEVSAIPPPPVDEPAGTADRLTALEHEVEVLRLQVRDMEDHLDGGKQIQALKDWKAAAMPKVPE